MKKRITLFLQLMSIVIFCFSLFGCDISSNSDSSILSNERIMPLDSNEVKGRKYDDIEDELKEAGFNNINYSIIYDLVTGWLVSNESVEYVSIDGNKEFSKYDKFDEDVKIVICYHTFELNRPLDWEADDSINNYDEEYDGVKYKVNIILDFDSNVALDKYKVHLRIDGKIFKTINHGSNGDFEFELKPGKHMITFSNIDDRTINGELELDVKQELKVSYKIKAHSSHIDMIQTELIYLTYYTVTLDSNGGNPIKPLRVKSGDILPWPSNNGKKGYLFVGWANKDGELLSSTNAYYINEDITLVAVWEKITPTEYEYAFQKEYYEYTLFYAFDVDKNEFVYVYWSDNDKYYEKGTYIGDFVLESKVKLVYDNPELNGYYEYFEYGGVMSDEFNNKHDYYFEYPHRISEKMIIIDL